MDRLTDREWKVMEALWQGGPQTLGEVLARLAAAAGFCARAYILLRLWQLSRAMAPAPEASI